jgi:hypothetical protein
MLIAYPLKIQKSHFIAIAHSGGEHVNPYIFRGLQSVVAAEERSASFT